MASAEHILLHILSQPRYLCVVRAAVEMAATRMGLDTDDADRVVLAVDEACANVIRHGYRGRDDQPVTLRMSPVQREGRPGIEIIIEDQTVGVDPGDIKGRPLNEVRPGGLGIHIIQEVMDEIEYGRCEGGAGIRLRMVKYAGPRAAATDVRERQDVNKTQETKGGGAEKPSNQARRV